MFLSSKLTHRFEVRVIFVLGQLWKVELISKEGNRISTHTSLGQSITSKCKRKCKCKELLLWTTPTQMQTQASTQGIKNFSFSWVRICVRFLQVWIGKSSIIVGRLVKYFYCVCVSLFSCVCFRCVESLAFLFAFAFAFASHVWTSLQILLWNDILIINNEYVFNLTIGSVSYKLSRSVSSLLHKINDNKIKGLRFGLFCSTGRKIRGITRRREYVNFLFEWQKQYQTSERSKPVRYLSYHENIKFISLSHRLIFFLIILTINIRGWDCKPGFNINTGY